MAKKKTEVKELNETKEVKAPLRDAPDVPDFTYSDKPMMAYVRLNNANVIGFFIDYVNDEVSGGVWNDLDGTVRWFSGELSEPE